MLFKAVSANEIKFSVEFNKRTARFTALISATDKFKTVARTVRLKEIIAILPAVFPESLALLYNGLFPEKCYNRKGILKLLRGGRNKWESQYS